MHSQNKGDKYHLKKVMTSSPFIGYELGPSPFTTLSP